MSYQLGRSLLGAHVLLVTYPIVNLRGDYNTASRARHSTATIFVMAASDRAPFPTNPEDFDTDERISFSKASETYLLEDENGDEWEWVARQSKWVPAVCPDSC